MKKKYENQGFRPHLTSISIFYAINWARRKGKEEENIDGKMKTLGNKDLSNFIVFTAETLLLQEAYTPHSLFLLPKAHLSCPW